MTARRSFKVGDRVRLTGRFLRSTGQVAGGEGQSVWTVQECPCDPCKSGVFVATDEPKGEDYLTPAERRAVLAVSKGEPPEEEDARWAMVAGLIRNDSACKCGVPKGRYVFWDPHCPSCQGEGIGPRVPWYLTNNGKAAMTDRRHLHVGNLQLVGKPDPRDL